MRILYAPVKPFNEGFVLFFAGNLGSPKTHKTHISKKKQPISGEKREKQKKKNKKRSANDLVWRGLMENTCAKKNRI